MANILAYTLNLGNYFFRTFYNYTFGLIFGHLNNNYLQQNNQPRNITKELEDEYGGVHPAIFEGKLADAIQQATNTARFLVIYIHSKEHENTPKFCENVLFTNSIRTYIDENFVFWLGDISTVEGAKVARNLQVFTYPYIGIIHASDSGPILKYVKTGQELANFSEDDFLHWLISFFENNQHILLSEMYKQNERDMNRNIMEEQDEAFFQALEADKEKELLKKQQEEQLEKLKQEELEKQRLEEERIQQEEQQKLLELENLKKQENEKLAFRDNIKANLLPEPDESQDVITIAIKLPNGERVKRRFHKDFSVQEIYNFVDSVQNELEINSYDLKGHFPNRTFDNHDISIKESKIVSGDALFIQEH